MRVRHRNKLPADGLERRWLAAFGVTGDGSATDGARIQTAIETAATDHLNLFVPPHPSLEGWRLAAAVPNVDNTSRWALTGLPGAYLSRRGDNTGFFNATNVSRLRVRGLGFDGRNSEAALTFRQSSLLDFGGVHVRTTRGFRLFDGTHTCSFRSVRLDAPTAGWQFGEGIGGMVPGHATVANISLSYCTVAGSTAEGLEWANYVDGLYFDHMSLLDCNTAQNEESLDLGGPANNVVFDDLLCDCTGTLSSYISSAKFGIRFKRANGFNPTNVLLRRPVVRLGSADVTSAGIIMDQVDGWRIEDGSVVGDLNRSLSIGGGFGTIGGTLLSGAREACLYAVGGALVDGFSPITMVPGSGGAQTFVGGGAVVNLV